MTIFDDDRPVKKKAHEMGQDLSMLSIDDLAARIDLLREEILRLEADIEKKQAGKSAADSLFRR